MKRIAAVLPWLAALAALAGCTLQPVPPGYSSMGEQVLIQNLTLQQAKDTLVRNMLSWKFDIQKDAGNTIIFSKKKGYSDTGLYDTLQPPFTEVRINCTLLDTPQGVKVLAYPDLIAEPGTPNEHAQYDNGPEAQELQLRLEQIFQ